MKTVIFVPTIGTDAQYIFCDREGAFKNGLLNAAGKILTGYHYREDAIKETLAKLPVEPFALLQLSFTSNVHTHLVMQGWLNGAGESKSGASLWTLSREGCIFLTDPEKAGLLMEYIPVPPQKIVLY